MKKIDIKILIGVPLVFIAVALFMYNLHWQAEEIQKVGLKTIIGEIWEGQNEKAKTNIRD